MELSSGYEIVDTCKKEFVEKIGYTPIRFKDETPVRYMGQVTFEIPKKRFPFMVSEVKPTQELTQHDNGNILQLSGDINVSEENPLFLNIQFKRDPSPEEGITGQFGIAGYGIDCDNWNIVHDFEPIKTAARQIKKIRGFEGQVIGALDWIKENMHYAYSVKDQKALKKCVVEEKIKLGEGNVKMECTDINKVIELGVGECEEHSVVYSLILKELGYETIICRGNVIGSPRDWFTNSADVVPHAWVEVKQNQNWITIDPTIYFRIGKENAIGCKEFYFYTEVSSWWRKKITGSMLSQVNWKTIKNRGLEPLKIVLRCEKNRH